MHARFRYLADTPAVNELVNLLAAIDQVERVEALPDSMPQLDDPDSSSAGLRADAGPRARAIELELTDEFGWSTVRRIVQRVAQRQGAIVEFEAASR